MKYIFHLLMAVLLTVNMAGAASHLNSQGLLVDNTSGALVMSLYGFTTGTPHFSNTGLLIDDTGALVVTGISAGSGTVTDFSAGDLSPLFTTTEATTTTTPALSFSLSNAAGGTVFGRSAGTSGAPAYTAAPVLGIAGTTIGTLGFAGNTSGTVTVTPAATAGTATLTLPSNSLSGTIALGPPDTSDYHLIFPPNPTGAPANQASMWNSNSTNQARVIAWMNPFPKTTTKVCYETGTTADNTSQTYDIGIYTGSPSGTGTLIGHTGAVAGSTMFATTSTIRCQNFLASFTIPPGRVYVAFTTGATSGQATIFGLASSSLPVTAAAVAITTGGTLNTGITLPADANSGAGNLNATVPWLSFQ